MTEISRRQFNKLAGATGAVTLASTTVSGFAIAQGKGKVVIVGGGAGGGTVAHQVKKGAPDLDVTLIEAQPRYTSCFFSNLYIGGFRSFQSITHSYDDLKALGVKVVTGWAKDVDTSKKVVKLESGDEVAYDRLVLSPGIGLKYDSIEGYSPEAAVTMPHAWQAGVQTQILKRQLTDMEDGGVVVMAPPPNPFRCPPGPYERASMIAHYLKYHKPASKLIIFDPKPKFSKMGLFQEGWNDQYPGLVEWIPPEMSGKGVKRVDPATMTVHLGDGEKVKAAVANIIPAQRAGAIAHAAGCADGDWCPIKPDSFASAKVKDVFVLGDASVAKAMPKSAFSANSQAKVVANTILAELAGKKKFPARFRNTCWSLISTNNGVKVGASYKPGEKAVDVASKFISKTGETAELREATFKESIGWYDAITTEIFAKS